MKNTLHLVLTATLCVTTMACTEKEEKIPAEDIIETIELESTTAEPVVEESMPEQEAVAESLPEVAEPVETPSIKKADPTKAAIYYRRGLNYATNKQFDKAAAAYLSACQYGETDGCHKFGWQLQKAGNYKGAARFYSYSCSQGIEKSCNNLGFIAEKSGKLEEAGNYYSMACMSGYKGSCKSNQRVNTELRQAH